MQNKKVALLFILLNLFGLNLFSQKLQYIMDMVHHNPGQPLYESRYNRPDVLKKMGYDAKCYFLFDSPTLAINWDDFDKDILPLGSPDREWVDKKAARLHLLFNECKAESMDIYAMSDLILLPKRLIAKYGIEKRFGNPQDTLVQRILRYQINAFFKQFPQMDGIVVRIGETYLEDAPYHMGSIQNKSDADKCIIPLMNLLREEVCVKLNKKLIFRTWWAFDTDDKKYMYINDRIEPHKNLIIAIKHCEGDFHRGNPFSKVLGIGRHQQLVEVQCAREYEGKGCYPNYIAKGVIEGFEEDHGRKEKDLSWNLRQIYQSGKLVGMWTWTRGGGWEGPYPKNEIWCDLNAWVMAQWANHPNASEASIFNRYCKEVLKMDDANANRFRELALLSEKATLLGMRSKAYPDDVMAIWVRDEYITFPDLPKEEGKVQVLLKEKDEAVDLWKQIVTLSKKISINDKQTKEAIQITSEYGLQMYKIYRSVFYLSAIKKNKIQSDKDIYINEYDKAWHSLNELAITHPTACPSLFSKTIIRRTWPKVADTSIQEMRK